MARNLPHKCPSCEATLKVSELSCEVCETMVSGKFELPQLAQLTRNEQDFILNFVRSSGSLKEMSQKLGLSYPTVRNLLDEIIIKLNTNE